MSEIIKITEEREREKLKTERKKGVAEAIVIVCELNDFVMRLS